MFLFSKKLTFFSSALTIAGVALSATLLSAPALAVITHPIAMGSLGTQELSASQLQEAFHRAAQEFGVPVQVLQGVAFVETRWNHVKPDPQEAAGDENEHPPVYGIMGLRDDDFFGHSLTKAASLIHATPDELKNDPVQNIRGAAALLASLASGHRDGTDPLAWIEAVRRYSGIPQNKESTIYLRDVYKTIHDGYSRGRIGIQPVPLEVPRFTEQGDEGATEPVDSATRSATVSDGDDEEPPMDWDPSANFNEGGIQPKYIVIHDTEGSFAGSVSWLRYPGAKASAHYVIRSRDGHVTQLVKPTDRAWHARCWNRYAIGIEHEGFVDRPEYFTDKMYESSAKLVRSLAHRFGIPLDAMHVFGHNFWQTERFSQSPLARLGECNTHHDPGQYWDWSRYFALLGADSDTGGIDPGAEPGAGDDAPIDVSGSAEVPAPAAQPSPAPVPETHAPQPAPVPETPAPVSAFRCEARSTQGVFYSDIFRSETEEDSHELQAEVRCLLGTLVGDSRSCVTVSCYSAAE